MHDKEEMSEIEKHRVYFRMFYSLLLSGFAAFFLYKVALLPQGGGNEYTGPIVGFLLGVVFSTLVQFYYGSSEKKQDKE